MQLQHVNLKLLVRTRAKSTSSHWFRYFTIGFRTRPLANCLDVADYRHVNGGPGVVLIGQRRL